MIPISRLRRAVVAIAFISAASISARAQDSAPLAEPTHHASPVAPTADASPLMKQFHAELGQSVVDYWTPKLNAYKVRIDRMLAPADLDRLNRLRVRFNVLASEWLRGDKDARKDLLDREKDELVDIYNSVRELAGSYRPAADALGETVMNDVGAFFPAVMERMDSFSSSHRAQLDNAGGTKVLAKAREHVSEIADLIHEGHGKLVLKMIYPVGMEPILMLYDGTDLKTLLHHVEQLSMGKGVSAMTSGAIAGYALPEETALAQSVPNPASTSAAITYRLAEPSGRTMLRLFNAQGDLVGTYDQGARPAGEQSVAVDLSKLPSGTYLYHLTIQTSKGERVYSKTLQVVR